MAQYDGSIRINTEINTDGFKKDAEKLNKSMKSQAASLAAQYRKQGMNASDAFKKAWSEIERTSKSSSEKVSKTWGESAEKIRSSIGRLSNTIKKLFGVSRTALSIIGSIGRSASAIKKETSGMRSSFDALGGTIKKIGIAMAAVFSVRAIAEFGKEATRLGSELQEVENVVSVAFPNMTQAMNEFASSAAKNFGLSETMAKQYSSLFGIMAKQFGFAEKEAFEMGTTLAGLAGDVASFFNITQDEAYTKLKSVFSGETETLKDLGVVMTQTALDQYALANGIGKTTQQMTEQEKVALRYRFVLEQLSQASGDFIRTSGSWANQTRLLKLQFDSLKATLGQGLINVLTPVLKMINALLAKLNVLAQSFKAFTELITGNKASSGKGAGIAGIGTTIDASQDTIPELGDDYNTAASGAENLASATEDAAEATKEAEKAAEGYLSPLDEINKIGKRDIEVPEIEKVKDKVGDTGGAGGAGNVAGVPVDYGELAKGQTAIDELSDKFSGLYDLIKKKDWEGLGRSMASGINTGLQEIYDAINWENVGPKIESFIRAFTQTFNSLADNLDWDLLGRTIGAGINTLVNTFNLLIGEGGIDFKNLGLKIAAGLRGMIEEVDWTNLGNLIGNYFMIAWKIFSGFIEGMWSRDGAGLTGWAQLGTALGQAVNGAFEKIDFGLIGDTLARGLNGAFETLKNFALTVDWDSIATNIYTGINNLIHGINWVEAGKSLSLFVTELLGMFRKVAENTDWEGLGRGIGDFLANIDWITILTDVGAILYEAFSGLLTGLFDSESGTVFALLAGFFIASKLAGIGFKFADALSTALTGKGIIATILPKIGTWLTGTFAPAIMSALESLAGVLFTPAGLAVVAAIVAGFLVWKNWDSIKEWATTVKDKILEVWENVSDWFSENVTEPIAGFFEGLWTDVSKFFSDLWDDIKEVWESASGWFSENIIEPVVGFFQGFYERVKQIFEGLWIIVQAVWIVVSKWFDDNVIQPVVDFFKGLYDDVSGFFSDLWDGIKGVWKDVSDWFSKNVTEPVTNFFEDVWTKASGYFSSLWNDIKGVWESVSGWFSRTVIEPVQNAWKTATDAIGGFFSDLWRGIANGVVGAMNGVIGAIESAINFIINAVNSFLSGFNSVVSSAASIVGVEWGGVSLIPNVNLSKIPVPYLAQGTVVPPNKEFMAVLGDNTREHEVVSPISTIEQAVENVLRRNGGTGGKEITIKVPVYIGDKQVYEAVINYGKIRQMATGKNDFALGGV